MHRLISSRLSVGDTVLSGVADNDAMLQDLMLLDGATNDRIQGEQHGLIGIGPHELLYGIPGAQIVNAAFTHSSEHGARFNDHTRGAWYAADERETSLSEVIYYKARRLADIVVPGLPHNRPDRDVSTYDDWLADFRSQFHTLEPPEDYSECLQAEPVPQCYAASQQMARHMLEGRSNGLVYPSVRRAGHWCIVCFRPTLVSNPRLDLRLEITLTDADTGYQHEVRSVDR